MKPLWTLAAPPPRQVSAVSRGIGCHPITAKVLVNRGINTPAQARAFLSPSLSDLRSPDLVRDMDVAAERLRRAVTAGEPILVFGDYDADGVTAAALLYGFLSRCGATVGVYLPHRLREGYGLQSCQVRRIARQGTYRLLVTVDCGSASREAVAEAASAGLEVIVTDHHQVAGPLPRAQAVVNPCRPDCPSDLSLLSGVGVSFYLVIALRQKLREAGFWTGRTEPNLRDYCDLVALGTVADMVPLRNENRILVKAGLSVLRGTPRPGMARLMAVAGIHPSGVDAEALAYRLAPRINAAGRMAHAIAAFRLLSAADDQTAGRIAPLLDRLNDRRQRVEGNVLAQALELADRSPALADRHTVVLSRRNWPEGVLGIVASRMVRQLNKPVALLTLRGDTAKGSARSVAGIDLFRGLQQIEDCLERYGGHSMAAGITVSADRLEAFTERFEQAVTCQTGGQRPDRLLSIDAEVSLSEVGEPLMEELETIGPFGAGNPEPTLMTRSFRIVAATPVGGAHLKMKLRPSGGAPGPVLEAIRFGQGGGLPESSKTRLAFRLRWNRWKGRRRLQMVVAAVEEDR